MIVFHASHEIFDPHTFHPLSHFGTARAACDRVQDYGHAYIYAGILCIERPLTIRDFGNESDMLAHDLLSQRILSMPEYHRVHAGGRKSMDTKALIDILRAKGHDGLTYNNSAEAIGSISHIIFSPHQFLPLGNPWEIRPYDRDLRELAEEITMTARNYARHAARMAA